MKIKQKYLLIIFLEIIILLIFTLLISHFNLDLRLQHKFYRDHAWYLANNQPWLWFYKYGTYPSIVLTAIFLVLLLGSISIRKFVPYRHYALLVLLTLIIGPGLLINGIFKDRWGRPRPRQIQQFGGKWEFKEVWQPGTPGKGKSFPCGHCSMGFHFIVVYYIFRRRNKIIRYSTLGGSLIYGILIGVARMAQGAHFASDVLWSAGFTYITATILYYAILKIPQKERDKPIIKEKSGFPGKGKILISIFATIIALALLILIFLFSKPLYEEYEHTLPSDLQFNTINLSLQNTIGDITIIIKKFTQPINIQTNLSGFGYPERTIESRLDHNSQHDTLYINYTLFVKGIFYEIEGKTHVELDSKYPLKISAKTDKGDITIANEQDSSVKYISIELSAPKGEIKKIGF